MAKAKKRKMARKTAPKSAKRPVKKRKAAPKRKAAAKRAKPVAKKTTFLDKITGAAREAAALRLKLEGSNTFED